ncbi:hypothetical protein D9613_010519 [Agrocybe pediades]|uniref:Uncharacterized protein n=1 Tax=Agrocybe pediades TaxID=84607 RepID=A0A8H4VJK3_9AGAR|nr:hypothetical protein D9613_010519 [Agrocybe pediades]
MQKGVASLSPKSSPRPASGDVWGSTGSVAPVESQKKEATEAVIVTPDETTGEASPPPPSPRMEELKGGMTPRSWALAQLEGHNIPPSTPAVEFALEVPKDIAWGPIVRKARQGWGNRPPDPPNTNKTAVIGLEDPASTCDAASSNPSVLVNQGLPTLANLENTESEMVTERDTDLDMDTAELDNGHFEDEDCFFGIRIAMTKQVSVVVEECTEETSATTRKTVSSTVECGPRTRTAHGWCRARHAVNTPETTHSDTRNPVSVRVKTCDILSLSMQRVAHGPVEHLLGTMQADPLPDDLDTDDEDEWVLVEASDFECADRNTGNAGASVVGTDEGNGTRSTDAVTPVIMVEGCAEGSKGAQDFLSSFHSSQVMAFGSLPLMDLCIIYKFIRRRVLRSRGRKPRSLPTGGTSVLEPAELAQQQDRSMTSSDTCSTLVVPPFSSKCLGKKVDIYDAASDSSVFMEGDTRRVAFCFLVFTRTFLDITEQINGFGPPASPASVSTPSVWSQGSFIEALDDAKEPAALDATPATDRTSGNGLGQAGKGASAPAQAPNGANSRRRSGPQALQLVDRWRQQTEAQASTSQAASTTPPLPSSSTGTFVDDRRLVRHYGVFVDPLTIPRREARRSLSINPPGPSSSTAVALVVNSATTPHQPALPAAGTVQAAGPSRNGLRPLLLTAQSAGEDSSTAQEGEQSTLETALTAARRFLGF